MEEEKYIELYPGNWLYNAGVIGFFKSVEDIEKKDSNEVKSYFSEMGIITFDKSLFTKLEIDKRYFTDKLCDCLLVGNVSKTSKTKYPNYINPSNKGDKDGFEQFVKELSVIEYGNNTCPICGQSFLFNNNSIIKLNEKWKKFGGSKDGFEKFIKSISKISNRINESLGGADSYPNGYWAGKQSTEVCPLCAYILIHHHIALTRLIDSTKIFINSPSFRLMYELNTLLEKLVDKENAPYKSLLAMSVIELSVKTKAMMNSWASMDIEIVAIKRSGVIEFISLPYETICIISNKRIAELLSSIGEFKVLNMVIDNKWNDLVELGYRILKIAMKASIGPEDRDFIYKNFYIKDNQEFRNLKLLANKILKLYALIEERTKTKQYEYIK